MSNPGKTVKKSPFFKEIQELTRQASLELLFELNKWNEKCSIRMKPNFNTACWIYRPPHDIMIGDGLFEDDDGDRFCRADYDKKKYVKNHIVHEQGHGEVTHRVPKEIRSALKAVEAPFSLYNLFEDARMEEFMRNRHGYKFEWLTMEIAGVARSKLKPRPEPLLFSFIQAEGDYGVVEKACRLDEHKRDCARVYDYYKRIIAQPTSLALMPILKEWLEEWPMSEEDKAAGPGEMSDLELSAELMENPELLEEFLKNVESVSGSLEEGDPDKPKVSAPAEADPELCSSMVASKGNLLKAEAGGQLDKSRVAAIVSKFRKFLAPRTLKISTTDPQKRFSARRAMVGRPPYLKKKLEGHGRRKVVMVVDVSGSMGGGLRLKTGEYATHISEGVLIAAALSDLARQHMVEGYIILSGVDSGGPRWQTFRLPMMEHELLKIRAFAGAEGLEYAMKSNLELLLNADEVLVYTDGQICDKPVDKPFFNSRGIFTWGLYAGDQGETYLPKLLEYFDKGCIRHSAEELVDVMLAQHH